LYCREYNSWSYTTEMIHIVESRAS
jgi:hypothetical protein